MGNYHAQFLEGKRAARLLPYPVLLIRFLAIGGSLEISMLLEMPIQKKHYKAMQLAAVTK